MKIAKLVLFGWAFLLLFTAATLLLAYAAIELSKKIGVYPVQAILITVVFIIIAKVSQQFDWKNNK